MQKEKHHFKEVFELLEPFKEIPCIIGIFLYGSTIKKGIRKGYDIDIMIVIDDSVEDLEKEITKIKFYINLAEMKAREKELILHFQPVKPISMIWKLIRRAEPWLMSAISESLILYDRTGFLTIVKKLIKKGGVYALKEKIENLMTRAIATLISTREKLNEATFLLLDTITKASQLLLSYLGVYTTSANETRDMLIKYATQLKMNPLFIEWYDELIKINEKIAKGSMSEFRAEEIDMWKKRVSFFIKETENIMIELENMNKEKELREAYDYIMSICQKALLNKIKQLPKDDKEKIELFKKYFIDTNKIDKIHYKTLESLYEFVKVKKILPSELKYVDKFYIKTLEAAINEIIMEK